MPRKEKPIFVHSNVFYSLREAKLHFEGLTHTKMTWSAFLYILAAGALTLASLSGLRLHCPECGHESELYYRMDEDKESTNSEAPPSTSQSAP